MQHILLASTSTVYGKPYLSYLFEEMQQLYNGIDEILFIPYARPSGLSYEDYTQKAAEAFAQIGKKLIGIHTFDKPKEAIQQAQAYFTGGGNTFLLLNTLYYNRVLDVLKEEILKGKPYMGTSAGSNIGGKTIMNTNDMPIIYPPSFKAMGLIPFNLNPHYLDPDPNSTHMGETRETRINEYLVFNTIPVLGLREGSWLEGIGNDVFLRGDKTARWFEKDKSPIELEPNTVISNLIV